MKEKNRFLDILTYTLLILGIASILFPLYYTFIAATLSIEDVTKVPMPLAPGGEFFHNLAAAWNKAVHPPLSRASMATPWLITQASVSMFEQSIRAVSPRLFTA